MFTDAQSFIGLLIAVVAIAAAAGTGWQRGKIAKLNADLDAADRRADRLSGQLEETNAALEKQTEVCAGIRRDHDALSRVVTGDAHFTAISLQLADVLALLRALAGRTEGSTP